MKQPSQDAISKARHELIEERVYLEALREILSGEKVPQEAHTLCDGSLRKLEKIIEILNM